MPIGNIRKGDSINVRIGSGEDFGPGTPVIVGDVKGVAISGPHDGQDGNDYVQVATVGEWLVPVAGTRTIGALVYADEATPVGGRAVEVDLTTVEGTTENHVFGFISAIGQNTGEAFVVPIQGNGIGAASND